jgi:hypothetical protein
MITKKEINETKKETVTLTEQDIKNVMSDIMKVEGYLDAESRFDNALNDLYDFAPEIAKSIQLLQGVILKRLEDRAKELYDKAEQSVEALEQDPSMKENMGWWIKQIGLRKEAS